MRHPAIKVAFGNFSYLSITLPLGNSLAVSCALVAPPQCPRHVTARYKSSFYYYYFHSRAHNHGYWLATTMIPVSTVLLLQMKLAHKQT